MSTEKNRHENLGPHNVETSRPGQGLVNPVWPQCGKDGDPAGPGPSAGAPGFQGESVDCHLAVGGNERCEQKVDRIRQPTRERFCEGSEQAPWLPALPRGNGLWPECPAWSHLASLTPVSDMEI